jgi:hypothetical protein
MRLVLRAVLYLAAALISGWLLAFAFWLLTIFVLGDVECNRGECGYWGELIDDHWWPIVLGFAALSAIALVPVYRRVTR